METSVLESSVLLRILDVSRRMAERRTFTPLLAYVVDEAIRLVGAERGYVVLPRPDGSLDFRVTRDQKGNEVQHPDDQISTSVLNKVMQTGEPLILRDAMADPQFSRSQSVMSLQLRSVMCAPLISYGKPIGAIYVENRSVRNRFREQDLSPFALFADQAATAIENAAQNDELEARVAERTRELEHAMAQLEKSWAEAVEANRLRTVLLASVMHDLRSPLALATGSLNMLRGGSFGPLNTEQLQRIEYLVDRLDYMLRLVDDLADLTRLEATSLALYPEKVALPTFLQNIYQVGCELRWPETVAFQLDLAPDLPALYLDPVRIQQVLLNLITNAFKFTAQGSVTLRARYQPDQGEVVLGITDTGEGIPADQMDQLFQRFHQADKNVQRKRMGSGLGLSICRNLVEMHGGRIWVESAPGVGSSFSFTLPMDGPPASP